MSIGGLIVLSGCGLTDHRSSMECMADPNGNAAFECIRASMFGAIGTDALIGAAVGAALGGAVSFALTRNPVPGLIAGAVVGGVAGGFIAYWNFLAHRAANDPVRMTNDFTQDCFADARRCQRLATASARGTEQTAEAFSSTGSLEPSQRDLIKEQIYLRNASITSMSQMQQIYDAVSSRITTGIAPMRQDLSQFAGELGEIVGLLREIRNSIAMVQRDTNLLRDTELSHS